MEEIKKEFVIEKSKYPEDNAKYVLYYHIESKYGSNWRRVFKGNYKECINRRKELLNG